MDTPRLRTPRTPSWNAKKNPAPRSFCGSTRSRSHLHLAAPVRSFDRWVAQRLKAHGFVVPIVLTRTIASIALCVLCKRFWAQNSSNNSCWKTTLAENTFFALCLGEFCWWFCQVSNDAYFAETSFAFRYKGLTWPHIKKHAHTHTLAQNCHCEFWCWNASYGSYVQNQQQ